MKIAIDIDDTITEAPEFFSALTQSMREAGHEIHIVTARDETYHKTLTEDQLEDWDIEYDALAFTVAKATYCHENDIDYAFDDMVGFYRGEIGTLVNLFKIRK